MKLNFTYYLLIALCLVSCNSNTPNTFILEGEIDGVDDSTKLILSYLTLENNKWTKIEDSTYVIDKKFIFKNNITDLTAAFLDFENNFVVLYLEPATIKLKLDKNKPWEYELSGTKAEPENLALREKLKPHEEELYKELSKVQGNVDQINSHKEGTSERDSLMNILEINKTSIGAINKQIDQIKLNYIFENKTGIITPHLIYTLAKREFIGIDTLKDAYNNLPEKSKTSMLGQLAAKQIEYTEKLRNIQNIMKAGKAPNFTGEDISGKAIRLSDHYKQNYILLDFWASWCKPCLSQIPQTRKVYDKYKDKGLEIIGISLDSEKSRWRSVVEKYKLGDWSQILSNVDSDYFPEDISDNYSVEYIPCYFLIDNKGNILARWEHLGEEELSQLNNIIIKNLDVNAK